MITVTGAKKPFMNFNQKQLSWAKFSRWLPFNCRSQSDTPKNPMSEWMKNTASATNEGKNQKNTLQIQFGVTWYWNLLKNWMQKPLEKINQLQNFPSSQTLRSKRQFVNSANFACVTSKKWAESESRHDKFDVFFLLNIYVIFFCCCWCLSDFVLVCCKFKCKNLSNERSDFWLWAFFCGRLRDCDLNDEFKYLHLNLQKFGNQLRIQKTLIVPQNPPNRLTRRNEIYLSPSTFK